MLPGKKLTGIGVLIFLLLLAVTPVMAGGWSVLTLDELPQNVQAGEPFMVRFVIRGHGISPASGMEPVIHAIRQDTLQRVQFNAEELSDPGHYEAIIELPEAGVWRWKVDGYGEHPLPDLQVGEVLAASPATLPARALLGSAAAASLVMMGLALGFVLQRRRALKTWAWGIVFLPVLAAGLLAFNTQAGSGEPIEAQSADYNSAYAYGEALFVAKGCATCHTNTRIPTRYVAINTAVGPNLSAYPTTAEYLRVWLKDPSEIKPGTKMPDLGLKEQEIEALISFLIEK